MVQVSKRLVVRKEVPIDNSLELLTSLDIALADYYCEHGQFEKGIELFRKALAFAPDHEKISLMNKYLNHCFGYAGALSKEGKHAEAGAADAGGNREGYGRSEEAGGGTGRQDHEELHGQDKAPSFQPC